MHLVCQPVNLPAGVTEDDSLRDGDRLVEVTKGVQLPFLLFHCDVELLDTLQSQLIPLDEDPDWISHELLRHLEHIRGHGGREKNDLSVLREELEDLIDLVLETTRQHLVGFIETEDLDVIGSEGPAVDHIKDTTGGPDDDVSTLLQFAYVLTDVGPTDTDVAFDVHVVPEGEDNFLNLLRELTGRCQNESLGAPDREVKLLENGDGEGRGLASTGLSLGDDIVTLDDGNDRTLLDGGGTLEARGGKRQR